MVSITVRTKQQTKEAEKRRGFWFLAMAASTTLGMFGVAGAISPLVMREHDYLRGPRRTHHKYQAVVAVVVRAVQRRQARLVVLLLLLVLVPAVARGGGARSASGRLVHRAHAQLLRGLRVRLRGLGGLLLLALEVRDLVEELDDGGHPRLRIRRGQRGGDRVVAVARLRARARGRAVLAR